MVEISLLSGNEGLLKEGEHGEQGFCELDLLEVTQRSSILDLFYDTDCVAKISPYLAEVK